MALNKLDHYSIRTTDVPATQSFYEKNLSLQVGPRPQFPFPGCWLYNGSQAVVHVIGIDPNDAAGLKDYLGDRAAEGPGSGNLDHIAFTADNLPAMRSHFKETGVEFRERHVPGMALDQIFLTDPTGIVIELNFAA